MRELERRVVLSGDRPPLARPPLRDGLPEGRHRPPRHGAARPAGRVPARGLRAVPADDGRRSAKRPSASSSTSRSRSPARSMPARCPSFTAKGLTQETPDTEKLSYSAPSEQGGVEVRNQRGQIEKAATARAQRASRANRPAGDACSRDEGRPGREGVAWGLRSAVRSPRGCSEQPLGPSEAGQEEVGAHRYEREPSGPWRHRS